MAIEVPQCDFSKSRSLKLAQHGFVPMPTIHVIKIENIMVGPPNRLLSTYKLWHNSIKWLWSSDLLHFLSLKMKL